VLVERFGSLEVVNPFVEPLGASEPRKKTPREALSD
jgi:hypothetical protein